MDNKLFYLKINLTNIPITSRIKYLTNPNLVNVKQMYELIKTTLQVTDKNIILEVSEKDSVYKFVIGSKVSPVGTFFYMPGLLRLDIYSPENLLSPFIQLKNKKVVGKGYSLFLDKLGIDKLFNRFMGLL